MHLTSDDDCFICSSAHGIITTCSLSIGLPGEEIEEPSSPSLKRTEEAGIKVIHDVKSKLYIKVGYLIMHGIEFITIPFGNHVFCKGLKFWD